MFNSNVLVKLVPSALLKTAKIYILSNAVEQTTYNASDYPVVVVKGRTSLQYSGVSYHSTIRINEKTDRIISCSCSCAAGSGGNRLCIHEAAVLSCYVSARETGKITFGQERQGTASSFEVLRYLEREDERDYIPEKTASAYLQACIEPPDSDSDNHSLTVQFRIGAGDSRVYVLKSIADLMYHSSNHVPMIFGKSLSFVPCEEAFEPASRPMYRFLRSLYEGGDEYEFRSPDYYYNQRCSDLTRHLTLRGRYLDEFFACAESISIFLDSGKPAGMAPLRIVKETPSMHASLRKTSDGRFVFTADSPVYLRGSRYVYFVSAGDRTVYCSPSEIQDPVFRFLDFCNSASGNHLYINPAEIRQFIRRIRPGITALYDLDTDGFSLMEYLPPKPAFRFYLDLPQPNIITCEAKAVYQNGAFSIFDSGKKAGNLRNTEEEKAVERSISHFFNAYDPESLKMAVTDDDDMTAVFLSEGIPYLQTIGEVFISDSLKKLQVRPANSVSIGVSLSGNLLDLSVSGDQRTLDDLSEILSRYKPKKKYYRLKSGSFVTVQDEAQLAELARLAEDLQLSAGDIRSGNASVPSYRAMYIDKTADSDSSVRIERDSGFRKLIEKMNGQNTDYDIPSSLHADLRDYQKEGFFWMRRLYDSGFSALLADDMGLGKTLQVITLLCSFSDRKQSLVVCPASLVYNWRNELRRFAPDIPAVMISGSAKMRALDIKEAPEDAVLITSYDTLKRDIDLYREKSFTVEIIDEAQFIKNAATQTAEAVKKIQAGFRIALTGTPIENRLSELWSIFDYLLPGYLFRYKQFKNRFEIPIVRDSDPAYSERLRRMISPFVLRRRKTDVLKDLPEKLEKIYYAPLADEQKELYEARVQRLKLLTEGKTGEELRKEQIAILAELTRLRQICCAPSLIYDNYHGNSEKEDLCIQLIRTAVEGRHKILLFSQFRTMLERLNERLEKEHISYYFLSGETPKEKRAELVDSFQQDDTSVFSISLKAGGTGLNLTAADIVIHYDPWWNVAAENQASDRTHRIGQTNPVTVYKLIVEETIEEKIIRLQNQKSALADEILSSDEMSSSAFSIEELLKVI